MSLSHPDRPVTAEGDRHRTCRMLSTESRKCAHAHVHKLSRTLTKPCVHAYNDCVTEARKSPQFVPGVRIAPPRNEEPGRRMKTVGAPRAVIPPTFSLHRSYLFCPWSSLHEHILNTVAEPVHGKGAEET